MNKKEEIKISKFLSLILRHKPQTVNLQLDKNGWADIKKLIQQVNINNKKLNLDFKKLEYVVENNDKQRFIFDDEKTKIRANQGHSIKIDLGYEQVEPPEYLYHGTAKKNIGSIMKKGLIKRQRHHVHLSSDTETAVKVGSRHGKPVVLKIQSKKMHHDGLRFYLSDNGVWLTDFIQPEYIEFPKGDL